MSGANIRRAQLKKGRNYSHYKNALIEKNDNFY